MLNAVNVKRQIVIAERSIKEIKDISAISQGDAQGYLIRKDL